jgi:hypothetical protein
MVEMEIIEERTSTALIIIPQDKEQRRNLFELDGGIGPSLAKLKEFVGKTVLPDASTEQGREDIKSFARKLVKTRTGLEAVGKELADEAKSVAKIIDANRKLSRDTIEALESSVLKPVEEWSEKEKVRQEKHLACIGAIRISGEKGETVAEISELLTATHGISVTDADCEEFVEEYRLAKAEAVNHLMSRLSERDAYERDQAELAQLRAEKEARDRAEREKEEVAAAQRRDEEAARKAAEAEERRKADIAAAEERAAERARQEERERIEREARAKALAESRAREEEAKRTANKQHQATINNEAADAIWEKLQDAQGPDTSLTDLAKAVVTAIAKGEVPYVFIRY